MNLVRKSSFSLIYRHFSTCSRLDGRNPDKWVGKSEPPFKSEFKNPVAEVYGGAESWAEDQVNVYESKYYL